MHHSKIKCLNEIRSVFIMTRTMAGHVLYYVLYSYHMAELIVFALSDNLSAENYKLSPESGLPGLSLLGCMTILCHPSFMAHQSIENIGTQLLLIIMVIIFISTLTCQRQKLWICEFKSVESLTILWFGEGHSRFVVCEGCRHSVTTTINLCGKH